MPFKLKLTYNCYYDGQQEKMYFDHFAKLIKNNFEGASIKFNPISKFKFLANSSTKIPKIAVFDYDNDEKNFTEKAKTKNLRSLYTNLNFDLWLLLHKKRYCKMVINNDDYIDEIRNVYKLNATDDIKKDENIQKILDKIEIKDIRQAIKNAKSIMDSKLERDKKVVNKKFYYYDNPSMNIHEFFEEILDKIEENDKEE